MLYVMLYVMLYAIQFEDGETREAVVKELRADGCEIVRQYDCESDDTVSIEAEMTTAQMYVVSDDPRTLYVAELWRH